MHEINIILKLMHRIHLQKNQNLNCLSKIKIMTKIHQK